MQKSIAENFLFVESSHKLWSEILERYGRSNVPQIFELHKTLILLQQENALIVEYYSRMKRIWDELNALEGLPDCSCGALNSFTCGILKKIIGAGQHMKLIQLLTGLNPAYAQVTTNILSTDPLPPVNKVYYTLQQVEKQSQLNSSTTNFISAKTSAYMASKPSAKPLPKREYKKFKVDKSEKFCDHCKMKGHTIDQCFKLVGYPDWYSVLKGKNKMAANVSVHEPGIRGHTPLDFDVSQHPSTSHPNIDPKLLALCQEVMKIAHNTTTGGSGSFSDSSVNFAGITSVVSVNTVVKFTFSDAWIVDIVAADHMACDINLFASLSFLTHPIKIGLPDGTITLVHQAGHVILSSQITLQHVLFVPSFTHNLLSVGKLLDQNQLIAIFKSTCCLFQDLLTKEVKALGIRHSRLYKFDVSYSSPLLSSSIVHDSQLYANKSSVNVTHVKPTLCIWHARLGHMSVSKMKHVIDLLDISSSDNMNCEACIMAKHYKIPFSLSSSHATHIFDLVHIDLWGPYRTPCYTGATYFLTILDDCSRTTWTHLLKTKTQVPSIVSAFLAYVQNHFNVSIKTIRTDNGTEIVQQTCSSLFAQHGIVHQKSIPDNPIQNGRVERKHKHLLETARAIQFHANLPKNF
ncbi:uncharacterized protein LOC104904224 [Beta vulgaris subsp. vulgaris]|uniref:uncharacterized protein LOC104904224 n=1 Tax=Beta vulgaris subsp. vulgaris TaxID=3555 RepID=UPI002036C2D3|nr:uncharacterized protein LOC104904224 [Beta vulgaris subsp. vulgaris]